MEGELTMEQQLENIANVWPSIKNIFSGPHLYSSKTNKKIRGFRLWACARENPAKNPAKLARFEVT